MKTFFRSLTVGIVTLLVLCGFVLSAYAATETRDGITVTLQTDKESYGADEAIAMVVEVTNTNSGPMELVTVKQLAPKGYTLCRGQTDTKAFANLGAGKSVSHMTVWVSSPEAETEKDFDAMEFYENNRSFVHIAGILLGVILLILVISLVIGRRKKRAGFLSLLLCAVILLGSVSGTVVEIQALEPVEGSIKVSTTVTVNGQKRQLEAEVAYSMDPGKAVCTVTFDTMGGSAVEPQRVVYGNTIERPDVPVYEGHVFVGWYKDEACETEFDFAEAITKSCTVYAYWINTEDETDTDGDGLTDELEKFFGTDKEKVDTDGDMLNDYVEVMVLNCDPLKTDTDGDGTADGQEDQDQDGLVNADEIQRGTDPAVVDTDSDALSDFDEINTYTTDPLLNDTDDDGVSDGKEIELGTDPLAEQATFEMEVFADTEDSVTPSVKIDLPGEQVESLRVEAVQNETFFPETMPGYLGMAYDFNVEGEFESAEISFAFDESLLAEGADPVIYYFNEDTQELEALETVIEGNVAKATVQHFSKYILIDRNIYEDQFMWTDVWDSEHNYTDIEIVFVIDDSGSMDWNDPLDERLEVARTLIDNLPTNSKIGLVRFDNGYPQTVALTKTLTTNKEEVKAYLTKAYFDSNGGTDMYNGINKAFPLFESTEASTLKMMIVLSDGETEDTHLHSSVIKTANNSNVRIYTVGLGSSSSYFNNYLKPLANNTGAVFYLASNATQLAEIYRDIKEKIDIETDSDDDGIPDYYEDNMICFNGVKIVLDKNNPDSDGDGLKDGEEVELTYEYNEDRTQVKVTGKIIGGNPVNKDTDGDGWIDSDDEHPMVWDVSDRDLAIFAALTYETPDKYNGKTIDDNYYFLTYASANEVYDYWHIVDCSGEVWADLGTHFFATTYKNGNNIVIAYRGTDGEWGEWVNNILGVGVFNYHSEEHYAIQYARRIARMYYNCNIYITGHSLGGYLAQFGASEIIQNHNPAKLQKVAYFNGIGLKYNKLLFWTKNDVMKSLKKYYNGDEEDPNLISYNIYGDVVSALGTHSGVEIGFSPTADAIAQHKGKYGTGNLDDALGTVGSWILKVLSDADISYYYDQYDCSSIMEYFWLTHETDSFLYHLTAGIRSYE